MGAEQATTARYTWGGDEFLFVEVDEAMSLEANFKVMQMARSLHGEALPGVTDICPANASMLVRFDPDVVSHTRLLEAVQRCEAAVVNAESRLETRVVEVPVWYDDEFTAEVGARFRAGFHQEPDSDDLHYAAKVNGLTGPEEFIARHHGRPWIVSMVGFVAGLPFLFQLAPREEQLEVPKYLSPRTDTPPLTVGHGGCFAAIYSVRGAGGYQMFGVAAAPIYDVSQSLPDFSASSVFFRPGDVVVFKPIDRAAWQDVQQQVEERTFTYRTAPFTLDLADVLKDPDATNDSIRRSLDAR